MAELKTKVNDGNVVDFINSVPDEKKRQDSQELVKIFQEITGEEPKMWGPSIVGYGKYHYKSERSSQEGDWPLSAFSPRKQNLSLYLSMSIKDYQPYLDKLGKHKTSVGCLYINRLSDINMKVLKDLIKVTYTDSKKQFNA